MASRAIASARASALLHALLFSFACQLLCSGADPTAAPVAADSLANTSSTSSPAAAASPAPTPGSPPPPTSSTSAVPSASASPPSSATPSLAASCPGTTSGALPTDAVLGPASRQVLQSCPVVVEYAVAAPELLGSGAGGAADGSGPQDLCASAVLVNNQQVTTQGYQLAWQFVDDRLHLQSVQGATLVPSSGPGSLVRIVNNPSTSAIPPSGGLASLTLGLVSNQSLSSSLSSSAGPVLLDLTSVSFNGLQCVKIPSASFLLQDCSQPVSSDPSNATANTSSSSSSPWDGMFCVSVFCCDGSTAPTAGTPPPLSLLSVPLQASSTSLQQVEAALNQLARLVDLGMPPSTLLQGFFASPNSTNANSTNSSHSSNSNVTVQASSGPPDDSESSLAAHPNLASPQSPGSSPAPSSSPASIAPFRASSMPAPPPSGSGPQQLPNGSSSGGSGSSPAGGDSGPGGGGSNGGGGGGGGSGQVAVIVPSVIGSIVLVIALVGFAAVRIRRDLLRQVLSHHRTSGAGGPGGMSNLQGRLIQGQQQSAGPGLGAGSGPAAGTGGGRSSSFSVRVDGAESLTGGNPAVGERNKAHRQRGASQDEESWGGVGPPWGSTGWQGQVTWGERPSQRALTLMTAGGSGPLKGGRAGAGGAAEGEPGGLWRMNTAPPGMKAGLATLSSLGTGAGSVCGHAGSQSGRWADGAGGRVEEEEATAAAAEVAAMRLVASQPGGGSIWHQGHMHGVREDVAIHSQPLMQAREHGSQVPYTPPFRPVRAREVEGIGGQGAEGRRGKQAAGALGAESQTTVAKAATAKAVQQSPWWPGGVALDAGVIGGEGSASAELPSGSSRRGQPYEESSGRVTGRPNSGPAEVGSSREASGSSSKASSRGDGLRQQQQEQQQQGVSAFAAAARRSFTSQPSGGIGASGGGYGSGSNSGKSGGGSSEAFVNFDPSNLTLGSKLGSGAFGTVYRATVHGAAAVAAAARLRVPLPAGQQGLPVAVKVVPVMCDSETYDAKSLQALKQEVQVLSQLSHPNIVQFLGAYLSPPAIHIVEELCEGGSLHGRLHGINRHGTKLHQPLDLQEVLRLGIDVATAMHYLHPGIVHRDLKPQNVLLDRQGRAKLCDFGLVKLKDRTWLSTKNVHVGTPAFMAPEQFDGQQINEKVDVYAFAMLLFECVTGEQVWSDLDHPMQIIFHVGVHCRRPQLPPSVPAPLASLIRRCWDDDPTARPSFREILQLLQGMQRQSHGHAGPAGEASSLDMSLVPALLSSVSLLAPAPPVGRQARAQTAPWQQPSRDSQTLPLRRARSCG